MLCNHNNIEDLKKNFKLTYIINAYMFVECVNLMYYILHQTLIYVKNIK